ncbi:hypothetical protein [Ferroglobus sp.]|nr:hypothetical protein [Ferroglobus sp.]
MKRGLKGQYLDHVINCDECNLDEKRIERRDYYIPRKTVSYKLDEKRIER